MDVEADSVVAVAAMTEVDVVEDVVVEGSMIVEVAAVAVADVEDRPTVEDSATSKVRR